MNKTITEDFVSFEVAKVLKEKGFEGDVNGYYHIWDNGHTVCPVQEFINSEAPHLHVPAPTHQMVRKWLREIHKIDIDIVSRLSLNADDDHNYSYVIKHQYDKYAFKTYTDGEYQYFEDAVDVSIKYTLENLI